MLCSNCGGSVDDGSSFCIHCGHNLTAPKVTVNDSDRKELRKKVAEIVALGRNADKRISTLWIIVPLIVTTITGIGTLVVAFTEVFDYIDPSGTFDQTEYMQAAYSDPAILVLQLVSLAAFAMICYLSYELIRGQNRHFERERTLREETTRFMEKTINERYLTSFPWVRDQVRLPILWSIFIIIPPLMSLLGVRIIAEADDMGEYYGWMALNFVVVFPCYIASMYMLRFLMKDMAAHHERWREFTAETKIGLAKMGYVAGHLRTPHFLQTRETVIYVVATIFTGGIFAFYWFYAVIKDRNEHIEEQKMFEEQLLKLLDKSPDRTSG